MNDYRNAAGSAELKTILQAYYDANDTNHEGYFPYAAAHDDASGNCTPGVTRGRVPWNLSTCSGLAELSASLPNWFKVNRWWQVMYCSVAPGYVKGGANSCAGGCLTLGGNAAVPALFFTPGTPRGTLPRPSNSLADYLEETENRDGWSAGANDIYATPAPTPPDRDRVFILAGGALAPQCANNAAQLLALAPCGQPPRLNPQCSTLAAKLAVCTCAAAANQIITPPCENTLKPPQCRAAIATLKACNS